LRYYEDHWTLLYKAENKRLKFSPEKSFLLRKLVKIAVCFVFSTKKRNDYIELQDFIAWLNKNQRDPRLNEILVPTYDEKQASAIIKKYERNTKHEMQSEWLLQNFFAICLLLTQVSVTNNRVVRRSHACCSQNAALFVGRAIFFALRFLCFHA